MKRIPPPPLSLPSGAFLHPLAPPLLVDGRVVGLLLVTSCPTFSRRKNHATKPLGSPRSLGPPIPPQLPQSIPNVLFTVC